MKINTLGCHESQKIRFETETYLMPRSFFSVQLSLDGYRSFLTDTELTSAVGPAINGVRHFALTSLIRVGGFERLQTLTDFDVFVNRNFYVRPLKLRLIVVDIA